MKVKYVAFKEGSKIHNVTVSYCDSKAYDIVVNKPERWVGILPKVPVEGLGLTIIPFENVKYIQSEAEPERAGNSGTPKTKKDD